MNARVCLRQSGVFIGNQWLKRLVLPVAKQPLPLAAVIYRTGISSSLNLRARSFASIPPSVDLSEPTGNADFSNHPLDIITEKPQQKENESVVNEEGKKHEDDMISKSENPSANEPPSSTPLDSSPETSTSIEKAIPPTEKSSSSDDTFLSQRYYHYFDTQKIYSSLKYSGYTSGQADVIMRTMRDLLSRALSELQENAVPQWAAENEAYLFEAACSELKNEIQTTRQDQAEQFRANLARLQRDVELLGHEIDEVINALKTDIDMEVNERKNATRAEESAIQLKIQELNNKITIEINSDVKSEIEGLRWQTTRRGLMAVIFVAFILLVCISISKKEVKPVVKRREVVSGEEIHVPILTTSEVDDVEDRKVEIFK